MTIPLALEFQEFVTQNVASGRFRSEIDVIHEGLRLLREREKEQAKVDDLRREIAQGIEEADQGKTAPLNAQVTLERIMKEESNE